ncbi:MAG: hypothetical protein IKJ82_08770 [Oscillospiraceae bacterium]|nr:hypothetical protein [Oscillospiraceae bacterium]
MDFGKIEELQKMKNIFDKEKKKMFEKAKARAEASNASEMDKNYFRMTNAQNRIKEELFKLGFTAIVLVPMDDGKMLSEIADYFELVLGGIESFVKGLAGEEK